MKLSILLANAFNNKSHDKLNLSTGIYCYKSKKGGAMQTILKDDILNEKNKETTGKEKVDKIMNMIVESSGTLSHTGDKFEQGEQKKLDMTSNLQYLFSSEILIDGENKAELEELRDKVAEELKPSSGLELIIVDRIVSGIWRLRRCLKLESQLMNYDKACIQEYEQGLFVVRKRKCGELVQLKALQIAGDKTIIEGLSRYEVALERQIYKALSELNKGRQRALRLQKRGSRMAR